MQDVFYELPFLGSFFISFLLLAIGERFYVGAAFLLVVVIAAMLGNTELAFSVHIALMIEYLIVTAPEAASFSHIFTSLFLGFLVILLFVNVKEKKRFLIWL